MSHTHRFFQSNDVFGTLKKSTQENIQNRKPNAGYLDEIIKIIAMSAVSVFGAVVLCEYILKPIWHIIRMKMQVS